MKTNARGVELIKRNEGLRLEAYPDPVSHGEPWTIGWGHTGDVHRGMRITAHQAEAIFDVDMDKAERVVEAWFPGANPNEFAALVSLVFNVGPSEDLEHSRLRRKFLAGDKAGAANEFRAWCHSCGEVIQDLVHRRAEERELFLSPVAQEAA